MGNFSDRISSPGEKRYRECMAEIIGVLKKYDMAGAVTVVDQNRCMFKYHFPTWSCITITPSQIKLRAKREDFPSIEDQKECITRSAHCVMQMRDVAANTFAMMEHVAKLIDDKVGIEHVSGVDYDPELDN